jgi:hypothetical protein
LLFALFAYAPAYAQQTLEFETCNATNIYYEQPIEHPRSSGLDCPYCRQGAQKPATPFIFELAGLSEDRSLPRACVYQSMRTRFRTTGKFAHCVVGVDKPSYDYPRPCLSEKMFSYTYNSFVKSMRCVDLDPAELFATINHESGFHANILSPSGSTGISQLTGPLIRSIGIDHKKVISRLKTSPKCEGIDPLSFEPRMPSRDRCDRMYPPYRMAQSLIYAGIFYKDNQALAESILKKTAWASKLSEQERKLVQRELALTMYNGGPGGIKLAFKAYARELRPTSYADFKSSFVSYLAHHYGEGLREFQGKPKKLAARRAEVSAYMQKMAHDKTAVEKEAGATCGR